jgi:hypothetical protein
MASDGAAAGPHGEEPEFRGNSASTVTGTEEGRAFFQARLSIFGLCLFVLGAVSWSALAAVHLVRVAKGLPDEHSLLSPGSVLHFTNTALAGILWWATRRGRVRGSVLHGLDIGVSLGLVTVWGLSGATLPDATTGSFVALLSFVVGVLARAIVVPSTARRTLVIGVIGALVLVALAIVRGATDEQALGSAAAVACWAATAVTISTVASQTIFGLRKEAARARVLGQYTLESKIGQGGMGDVWRASHSLLRRPTAVKLLPPTRMGEVAIRRFEREVQLTARLTHPNTVAIYDYGRTRDGIFYYAMELLEGTDLDRLVTAHGPQPAERVLHVLTQICGALAEAHDLGLVHRDVKPANILLSPRKNEHEFAKIVDFGLVKSVDPTLTQAPPGVTATNSITGTPLYMAPESIKAPDSVDARADLYALGAVAWFLLVGRPPFQGTTIVEVCGQHLHAAPLRPSAALRRAVPADLEDAILACLEKDPAARPKDARALRSRLETCESYGRWKVEHATDWWRTHTPGEPAPPVESTVRQTIALDVGDRATEDVRLGA